MTSRRKREARARRPRVEVKETDGGRALKVEGTFASWYRPGSDVTRSVWDAIAAPVLALPATRRRKILLLGLAGGSAARVVRAVAPAAEITGVELHADIIEAAREHFDLDALGLKVVIGDALEFLYDDREAYDVVLEDIFVGVGRGVHKPGWLPDPGHELAKKRLERGGVLVSNTLDEASEVSESMCALFPACVRIEIDEYENSVIVGGPSGLSAASLRAAIKRDPVLEGTVSRLSLRTIR